MSEITVSNTKIKYKALYQWIVQKINDGSFPYHSKLPSESSLGDRFSISRQTVRNAMDQLAADGYIERRKGSGSFVKKEVQQHEKTIGVLLITIEGYINANVLGGLESILSEQGYGILLELSHNRVANETRFLQRMLERNVSGLIIEGVKSTFPNPNALRYQQLRERNIPYVFINNHYSNVPAPSVLWDDRQVSYELTQRLIRLGHTSIAAFFKFDERQSIDRYLGYIQALMDHNIEVQENLIAWYCDSDQPQELKRKEETLNSFVREIPSQCTALICYNDLIACSLILKLMDLGIAVPEQLTVASFDNSDMAKLYDLNQVASISHPKEEMGIQAASLLLKYIRNPSEFPLNPEPLILSGPPLE